MPPGVRMMTVGMLAIAVTACGDAPTPVVQAPATTSAAIPGRVTDPREEAYRAQLAQLAEVDGRAALIDRELVSLSDHPWAGRYYSGDRLGTNVDLRVAPNAGVAVTNRGDVGLSAANAGSVQERAGRLHLRFRFPQGAFAPFPDELLPLKWGERRYLIAPAEMASFVEAVNEGLEPRPAWAPGMFLLAVGDEHLPIDGLPNLPSPWRETLRMRPIDARVRKVVQASGGDCRTWL